MAQVCELTGKRPQAGNTVSKANNKTRMRQMPNLKCKRFFIPEAGRTFRLRLSTSAIRTISKAGSISRALRNAKPEKLSPRLRTVRSHICKQSTPRSVNS